MGRRARRPTPAGLTALLTWSGRDQHQPDSAAPFDPHDGREDASRDLAAIVRSARGDEDGIQLRTVCGPAAAALLDAATAASLLAVGARGGFRGLLVGSDEARARRCGVVAMYAWPVSYAGDLHGAWPTSGSEDLRDGAERLLDRELALADTTDLVAPPDRRVAGRRAAAALVEAGDDASLIVLGSRGRRPATGLLLGSVSDQVTRHARCPVVVVPTPPGH